MVDFSARARDFAAEKISDEKNRAEKENIMHKHKGRSIWCVETVVCGGHWHVKPWERASWRISRLSGPLRRRFARICAFDKGKFRNFHE
jgi:hypothetical protein